MQVAHLWCKPCVCTASTWESKKLTLLSVSWIIEVFSLWSRSPRSPNCFHEIGRGWPDSQQVRSHDSWQGFPSLTCSFASLWESQKKGCTESFMGSVHILEPATTILSEHKALWPLSDPCTKLILFSRMAAATLCWPAPTMDTVLARSKACL